ncbi:MAG: hypothetical protein K8T91_14210 [Planctomycetes bacterium]|nr:hypothetical protein [Planctomycetota bacterium]
MSRPNITTMTIPQAVELLRDTSPQNATAEQIGGLRDLVARTPTCLPLLGGREKVERFLEEAAARNHLQREGKALLKDEFAAGDPLASAGQELATPRRQQPLLELGLLLGGLTVVVGGMCSLLFGTDTIRAWFAPGAATPVVSAPGETSAADAVRQKTQARPAVSAKKPVPRKSSAPAEGDEEQVWNDWRVKGSPGALTLRKTIWKTDAPINSESDAVVAMVLGSKPASLWSERKIDAEHRWLRIELISDYRAPTGVIEVAADGRVLNRVKLEAAHIGTPLLASLDTCLGRTVKLELRYLPESPQSEIAVRSLTLAGQATRAAWTSLTPTLAASQSSAALSVQPDDSVLAGGENAPVESYSVTVAMPAAGATAVRLDALPDHSLPAKGPGRAADGGFLMTRFSAVRTASVRKLDRLPARYVRIELYGPPRALTLAEVEVFSGGENVARKKKATQSSTVYGAVAARANDGLTRNGFKQGSVTHTNNEPNAWWAVDLGRDYPVDKIVVYGRGGYAQEQANHRVVVIDDKNEKQWQFENPLPPDPSFTYGPFILESERVEFSEAAAEKGLNPSMADPDPVGTIRDGLARPSGWIGLGAGTVSSVVYTLAPQPPLGGQQVTFHLTHSSTKPGHNLGRFRLWSTTSPPPHQAETAVIVLPSASPAGAH